MQTIYKKSRAFFLCILVGISLFACNSPGSNHLSGDPSSLQDGNGTKKQDASDDGSNGQDLPDSRTEAGKQQEPLLGPDATDEELLGALGDEVNVVTDDNYIEMVTDFKEHVEAHSGKIYQIEGTYHVENGVPYVARIIVDGDSRTVTGVPLKYLTSEPEEGEWIQVTGVINEGEVEGEKTALLEVVILQSLEAQGQAEISVG